MATGSGTYTVRVSAATKDAQREFDKLTGVIAKLQQRINKGGDTSAAQAKLDALSDRAKALAAQLNKAGQSTFANRIAGGIGGIANGFDAANRRIAGFHGRFSEIGRSVKTLTGNIHRFGELTGVNKLARGFQNVAEWAFKGFLSIARMIPVLGALTGAGAISGLKALMSTFASSGNALTNRAADRGMTPHTTQAYENAAALGGSTAEDMDTTIAGLRKTGEDIKGNRLSAEQRQMLSKVYGPDYANSFLDQKGELLPGNEQFEKFRAATSRFSNPEIRHNIYGSVGASAGIDPLVRESAGDWAGQRARGEKNAMSDDDAAKGKGLNADFTELEQSFTSLGSTIASVLSKPAHDFTVWLTGLIEDNKKPIGDQIKEWIGRLEKYDWAGLGKSLKELWTSIDGVVQKFGGWAAVGKDVLELKLASFAMGLVVPFASAAASVLQMSAALTALNAAQGQVLLGGLGGGGLLGRALMMTMLLMNGNKDIPVTPDLLKQFPGLDTPDHPAQKGWLETGFDGIAHMFGFGGSAKPAPMPAGEAARNAQGMHDALIGQGLDEDHAAAVLSRTNLESGFNPDAVNGSSKGYLQYLASRRMRVLLGSGIDMWSRDPKEVARGLVWEGQKDPSEQKNWSAFMATHNAADAGAAFSKGDIRPLAADSEAARTAAGTGPMEAAYGAASQHNIDVKVHLGGAVPPGTTATARSTGPRANTKLKTSLALPYTGVGY